MARKKGSGIAMYVRDTLNLAINKEISTLTCDIEALFININENTSSTIVSTVYRPPSGNQNKFIESMTKILSILDGKKENVIIMGDFNINLFIDNKQRSAFEEAVICNGFTPTISVATHLKPNSKISCFDVILVYNADNVLSSGVIETHISHHRFLFLTLKSLPETNSTTTAQSTKPKMVIKYDYSKENLNHLNALLSGKLNYNAHINTFSEFINLFSTSIDVTCKLKVSKFSKRNRITNPWITTALINSISKRDRLFKNWKKTTVKICKSGDPRLHEEYRKFGGIGTAEAVCW